MPDLISIPVCDLRFCGLIRHALDGHARVRALRDDCLSWLSPALRRLVPVMDVVTRRWLERSQSPYVADVKAIAAGLDFPGIWFLNGSYQWGCTAIARDEEGTPWLARTLDWPFPGLGRHLEITHMGGRAGEFLTVTWPGYAGILTALAPGRFAAAINQAPLWRRTRKPWLRPFDIAANGVRTWRIGHCPPDHLLREVFETCADFDSARRRLENAPIARPVIFMLVGCRSGERCVIERTEEAFSTRENDTAAANDWLRGNGQWEARVNAAHLLTRSYEEARERNRARRDALASWSQSLARSRFEWLTPPVLNPYTRIAVEMCPAGGMLRALGYELQPGDELPRRATQICEIATAAEQET